MSSDGQAVCKTTTGGACPGSGEVCVPAPPSAESHCVVVDRVTGCAAPYTRQPSAFLGAAATCTCSCTPGTPTCPNPIVIASSSTSNCTSTQTYQAGSGCNSVGYAASLQTLAVPGQLTCAATGIAGSVVDDSVVCCLP